MDIIKFARGFLIAIIFGLLFTLWVNPGTTGGLLLLMALSSGFMYLVISVLQIFWVRINRTQTRAAQSEDSTRSRPKFRSRRRKSASDDGASGGSD